MTFGKREDQCWHWEYTGPYARSDGKKLRRFWCAAMILVCLIFGSVLLLNESMRNDPRALIFAAIDIGFFLTIPFVILWYIQRHGKQGCAYTANERVYAPFPSIFGGKHTNFSFFNVKTITPCRERDAIIINRDECSVCSIYADAEDYQAVWDFFLDRCPEAEITASVTGEEYDALFEIERSEEG